MIKREAAFTTKFQKWLKHEWTGGNAYFEAKVTTEKSLNFSEVKDHQLANLQLKKIIHKFSDALQWGTLFDVILCEGKGYVVIQYNFPSKEFFIIPVQEFIKEKETSDRKSLTEERARTLALASGKVCFLK